MAVRKNTMKGKNKSKSICHVEGESFSIKKVVPSIDQGILKAFFVRQRTITSLGHEFSKVKGGSYIMGSQVQCRLKSTVCRIH